MAMENGDEYYYVLSRDPHTFFRSRAMELGTQHPPVDTLRYSIP